MAESISPEDYGVLHGLAIAAEAMGGTWQVKLATVIEQYVAIKVAKNLPYILNHVVAAITSIVEKMNGEKTAASQASSTEPTPAAA